jgi:hypothetical protein
VARIQPNAAHDVVQHQRVEAAVPVTQVAVIRIGLRWTCVRPIGALQHEEVLGMRHVERSQDQRIQYAEHDCIGANGECQCEHGGQGESGRFSQLS